MYDDEGKAPFWEPEGYDSENRQPSFDEPYNSESKVLTGLAFMLVGGLALAAVLAVAWLVKYLFGQVFL